MFQPLDDCGFSLPHAALYAQMTRWYRFQPDAVRVHAKDRDGSTRVGVDGDIRYEEPMLLDPVDEDDPVLLFFDLEGHAVAAPHVNEAWGATRVQYSVDRCNLDFPPLMDKWKAVWAECCNRVTEYRRELGSYQRDPTNAVARDRVKQAAKRVRPMLREEQDLSSMARACVESAGDPCVGGFPRSV